MEDSLYAVGWDVGGWMGKKNGFVVVEVDHTQKLNWYYQKESFKLKEKQLFSFKIIFNELVKKPFNDTFNIVVGIDAPLSYPLDFIKFLNNESEYIKRPNKEIYNRLAYRETDRYIYKKYSKKPLSATFDRLGNNTTVAISHLRFWNTEHNLDFNLDLFKKNKINIIETYPALIKKGKYERAKQKIDRLIPKGIEAGTDNYDAAICALMAIQFGFDNKFSQLPSLVYPPAKDIYKEEGWIFHFKINERS